MDYNVPINGMTTVGVEAAQEDRGGFSSDTAALAFLRLLGNGNPNVEHAIERLRSSLIAIAQPMGVDCAVCGQQPAEPAVWVAADTLNSPHPRCVSSLAYMSQFDRERGREYVPLYAAPSSLWRG